MKLMARIEQAIGVASFPAGMLDQYSEDEIRAVVESGQAREFEPILRAHLYELDRGRQQRALDAAERAARSAERSARFAMWAAFISLVAIIVTLAK